MEVAPSFQTHARQNDDLHQWKFENGQQYSGSYGLVARHTRKIPSSCWKYFCEPLKSTSLPEQSKALLDAWKWLETASITTSSVGQRRPEMWHGYRSWRNMHIWTKQVLQFTWANLCFASRQITVGSFTFAPRSPFHRPFSWWNWVRWFPPVFWP